MPVYRILVLVVLAVIVFLGPFLHHAWQEARRRRREERGGVRDDALAICPSCGGMIEKRAGATWGEGTWHCLGIRSLAELDRIVLPRLHPEARAPYRRVIDRQGGSRPPCGWSGREDDRGVKWA